MRPGKLFISVFFFAVIVSAALLILRGVSVRSSEAETALIRESIRSAALTCYAVEGAYPESIDYLKEHYGVYYDEKTYHVSYDCFASNLFPDIYVTEGGGGK